MIKVGRFSVCLPHVSVHSKMVKKIVSLEDAVMFYHPMVGFTNKRMQDGSRDIGVIDWS